MKTARRQIVLALVIFGLAACALAVYRITHHGHDAGTIRHVIVISLDTTRTDHIGAYGNTWIQTPELDALARESVLFLNHFTVVPTTLSSHTTLFTGTHPQTHGTPYNGYSVHEDNIMLAEVLSDAGFHCAGFAGAFVLSSRFNFAQGFDYYDDELPPWDHDPSRHEVRPADEQTDRVIKYLDAMGIPDRLFLFVHYFDPHVLYDAPPPYDTMYDQDPAPLLPLTEVRQICEYTAGREFPAAKRTALRYAAEVTFMDKHVGRLLTYLEEREVLDDALVLVTSDHGENHWEHERCFKHGRTVYDTVMRAVWMVRLPGAVARGSRVERLTCNTDVLPTVLSRLSLPIPSQVEGQALSLPVPEADNGSRVVFGQASKPVERRANKAGWLNLNKSRFAFDGRFKLIQSPLEETEELYDLEADPYERENLLADGDADIQTVAAKLRVVLEEWASSADPLSSAPIGHQDPEAISRLRSLGYIGEDTGQ